MAPKQVAIIGSGCSGLVAIKTCIDEGLNPVCYESSGDIGGLWRFSSDLEDGRRGSVSEATVMNTSKEMMAFSDFPPPKEFPNFMHHSKVLEYYSLYAERFNLRQHIRFNKHVDCVHYIKSRRNCDKKETISPTTQSDSTSDKNDAFFSITTEHKCNNHAHKASYRPSCKCCHEDEDNKKDSHYDYNHNLQTSGVSDSDMGEDDKRTADDHGPWEVHVRDGSNDKTKVFYFDFVMVCTGHHAFINMPTIIGQSTFKGRIVHSRDVREPDKLEGSRHVVVGVGNSGCDMAVQISKKSKVFLSTRRGTWLMHRLQARGLPADIAFSNRLVFATAFSLPNRILNTLSARHLNQRVDHDLYGLRPRHGPIAAHPTVNDELPNRIACGQVVVKPNIRRLDGTSVVFDNGTVEDDVDTVIMATGYDIKYPFLDDSVICTQTHTNNNNNNNNNPLYLYMFPTTTLTSTPAPSLAIIGCVQPGGALAPVAEMQCRVAVKVFTEEVRLPSRETMVRDIETKRGLMKSRYVSSPRHTVQVDYIPYMDQLAALIGCKPSIGRMMMQDPSLALKCFLGPCTAYQYRLQGPGKWDGARETILTQMDRVVHPLMTRKCEHEDTDSNINTNTTMLIMGGLLLVCVAYGVYCFIVHTSMAVYPEG